MRYGRLGAASKYFHHLEALASSLAVKKVNIGKALDKLYPVSRDMTLRQVNANKEAEEFIKTVFKQKDDLQNFRGSAWGAYQALADYRSNTEPRRRTAAYADTKTARFLDGNEVINQAQGIILELAAY